MRVALAQALFVTPDILLLDEPTNHLDFPAVLWLQRYLCKYKNTLLVVSHDRHFLNQVTTDILHLHNKELKYYKGNYATFEKVRKEQLKAQKRSNASLQQSLKGAKNTVNQTVSQAFDDVTLLTQKLKTVEEQFSQVRVDKEHIEKGFRSELAAVQAKNTALQKNLLSCKMELEELSHRVKLSDEKIRQLTFDKLEAQKEANTARSQISVCVVCVDCVVCVECV